MFLDVMKHVEMADSICESVLCKTNNVFVYKIPPRTSNRGYRAADWDLENPEWAGNMKIVSKGKDLCLYLVDKNTGELFAKCLVDDYPGTSLEQVTDSSRYFVMRIQDDDDHKAFIGIGFADRADSFDLLITLQDYFRSMEREGQLKEEQKNTGFQESGSKCDFGFKDGETIRLNLSMKAQKPDGDHGESAKTKSQGHRTGSGLLPPPPSGHTRGACSTEVSPSNMDDALKVISSTDPQIQSETCRSSEANEDLFWNSESSSNVLPVAQAVDYWQNTDKSVQSAELWADFTNSASSSSIPDQHLGNWVSFD